MKKLLTSTYRRLLRFSARIGSAWLAEVLLRRALVRQAPGGARCHRVLCMGRSIFVDDVAALANCQAGGDFNFVTLHKGILDEIFQVFVGDTPEGRQLTEFNYHHSDLAAEGRRRYRKFLGRILDAWEADGLRFDAFLSGNFGYPQQQELTAALSERSIPFVCLFKEGLLIPEYLDEIAGRYIDGKVFLGRKIIFYSEQIRRAVLKSDAFEGREFSTAVCGIPRLDELAGLPPAKRRQVVFFSFHPSAKFNSFVSDEALRDRAVQRGDAYHRAVLQFAIDHPEWSVVIKTKAGDRSVRYIEEQRAALCVAMPDNVRVTNRDRIVDLLRDSEAVITFMSTTSIEALVAGRKVICPDFSDLFQDIAWDYFHDSPELVSYTRAAEDIAAALVAPDRSGEADFCSARDAFLADMVNGSDGNASNRACAEIADTIAESPCRSQAAAVARLGGASA